MIGKTLSHFEITAKLGEGGMGEVYEAKDTKLGRRVAIKVLPRAFVSDPERLARFKREARLLASLNHPNIASLHEVREEGDVHFLVMELAAGETIADRVARGPVPVEEAIPIALGIAQALEEAHERGIVHRDLKPGNVKVSDSLDVKVLDFGLAKALETGSTSSGAEDVSQLPTLTCQPTSAGVILGTAAYMSPEQARGREVDKRTDIWAFGVVLWEMLTGSRLFRGDSMTDVLGAVLHGELRLDALPPDVPAPIRHLLARCLERDPLERLRDIGEARIVLARPFSRDSEKGSRRRRPGWGTVLTASLGAAILMAALLSWTRPRASVQSPPLRVSFSFRLPEDLYLQQSSPTRAPVELAPDGSFIVFSARLADGEPQVFRRSIDSLEILPVEGAEGGRQPFVSPDSQWIGFFTRDGRLARVPSEGGLPERIYDGERLMAMGGCWGRDDRIYFARGLTGGIASVAVAGGEVRQLTTPDLERGEIGHWQPRLLPGGEKLIYGVFTVEGWKNRVLDLSTGEERELPPSGPHLQYSKTGYVAWVENREFLVAPFDEDTGSRIGKGRPMLSGVSSFHLSGEGTLVYTSRTSAPNAGELASFSEKSGVQVLKPLGRASQVRVAPGGDRLAVVSSLQLWIVDVGRGVRSPITMDGVLNNFPVWSRDGKRLAFNSLRSPHGIYVRPADGTGSARLVLERVTNVVSLPGSWSPDGRSLAVTELHPDGQADVSSIDLESGTRTSLVASDADAVEHSPAISPDGRWLAFTSDVSGRDEVYVKPYLREGRRLTVSTSGGSDPRWASDGRTLLFRNGYRFLELAVSLDKEELDLGVPQLRAELPAFFESNVPYGSFWDVAPNGDLIYLRLPLEQAGGEEIRVVVGWSEGLG